MQNRKKEQRRVEEESTLERMSRQLKNKEKYQRRREEEKSQRQSRIDAVRSHSAAVRMSTGKNFENVDYNYDS